MRISLQWVKRSPRIRAYVERRTVHIWTDEWMAWWRPNCAGYTDEKSLAGIYSGKQAIDVSHHAGPEKQIFYEVIK